MAIAPWRAACIQMPSRVVTTVGTREEAWPIIQDNLRCAEDAIDDVMQSATPPRLIQLPEFPFQGPPRMETAAEWIAKATTTVPGEITKPLQEKARQHGIFVAGNQFEHDPEWPGRHFNTSFLIDPRGEVIIRYRRVHTALWVSPHDFLDAYVERYGIDGIFPVVDTELGRMGMLACGEIMVPEASRVLMLRGAEVLLHPTNEPISPGEEAAKTFAAAANMMYVISANVAGPIGFSSDEHPALGGHSRIIDFDGNDLAELSHPGEGTASAIIDIEALRAARRDLTMRNGLLRLRLEIYRPVLDKAIIYPANQFLNEPMAHWQDTGQVGKLALDNLLHLGVATPAEMLVEASAAR